MSKERTSGSDLIRAAGGLLWRDGKNGYEIAVVRRDKYQDWSLPKGKLDPGETWEAGALREVREETGFEAKLLGFAGAVGYTTDKGPKAVRYWHMLPRGTQGRIEHDVSEVVWLPLAEARERLDYDLERAVLEAWDGPDVPAKLPPKSTKTHGK
jgi:ADP-ribose pyrophosphatase YjhB (NUDIX family)